MIKSFLFLCACMNVCTATKQSISNQNTFINRAKRVVSNRYVQIGAAIAMTAGVTMRMMENSCNIAKELQHLQPGSHGAYAHLMTRLNTSEPKISSIPSVTSGCPKYSCPIIARENDNVIIFTHFLHVSKQQMEKSLSILKRICKPELVDKARMIHVSGDIYKANCMAHVLHMKIINRYHDSRSCNYYDDLYKEEYYPNQGIIKKSTFTQTVFELCKDDLMKDFISQFKEVDDILDSYDKQKKENKELSDKAREVIERYNSENIDNYVQSIKNDTSIYDFIKDCEYSLTKNKDVSEQTNSVTDIIKKYTLEILKYTQVQLQANQIDLDAANISELKKLIHQSIQIKITKQFSDRISANNNLQNQLPLLLNLLDSLNRQYNNDSLKQILLQDKNESVTYYKSDAYHHIRDRYELINTDISSVDRFIS